MPEPEGLSQYAQSKREFEILQLSMSKRRNWDRVRNENKVTRHGSLPVGLSGWLGERQEAVFSAGELPLDDRKLIEESVLKPYAFICQGYFISVCCDVPLFAEMNDLDPAYPKTAELFAQIKHLFEQDLPGLSATSLLPVRVKTYGSNYAPWEKRYDGL